MSLSLAVSYYHYTILLLAAMKKSYWECLIFIIRQTWNFQLSEKNFASKEKEDDELTDEDFIDDTVNTAFSYPQNNCNKLR